MITMILGGLWHGAGWTFIVWGLFQGILLSINHMWRKTTSNSKLLGKNILNRFYWGLTFFSIVISWVIFRSSSLDHSYKYLKCLLGFNGITLPDRWFFFVNPFINSLISFSDEININKFYFLTFLVLLIFVINFPNTQQILNYNFNTIYKRFPSIYINPKAYGMCLGFLFFLSIANLFNEAEFLYFQF